MPTAKAQPVAVRRFPKKTPIRDASKSASELIDARIDELDDWRGKILARVRILIKGADTGIVEEWKWNIPVWSCNGIICTGETYRKAVKLTFAKGALLSDPTHLFNSSLEGNTRRAIDLPEASAIDADALSALVQAAVVLNKPAASGKLKRAA